MKLVQISTKEKEHALLIKQSFRKLLGKFGPKYMQVKDLPPLPKVAKYFGLEIIDLENTLRHPDIIYFLHKGKKFDIQIDNSKLKKFQPSMKDYVIDVLHRQKLVPGVHHVIINNLIAKKKVFDGDILFDGTEPVQILIGKYSPKTSCAVKVVVGTKIEFEIKAKRNDLVKHASGF